MNHQNHFDVVVIGGGLAGLSLSILLARGGVRVALFEKESYPLHRVCGEYISLESYDLVQELGVDLQRISVPLIRRLMVSAPSGKHLFHDLPLGGFGISRYCIDEQLAQCATASGVHLLQKTRVEEVERTGSEMKIRAGNSEYTSTVVCGAFGKRSNLDVRWRRGFVLQRPNAINNFVGVKYHVRLPRSNNLIELHNFADGYCGISSVEQDVVCICYLTTAKNLQINGGSIARMEEKILFRNPWLRRAFEEAEHLYEKPLTISQISFARKNQYDNGVFFVGDAASMIAPLCGNGMSMALHSGRMLSQLLLGFFNKEYSIDEAGARYEMQWQKAFGRRISTGRMIQRVFGSEGLSNAAVSMGKLFPSLLTKLIARTHGVI
jgi:menaquinone-9 beta-reductase